MHELVQVAKYYPPYFGGIPNYVQLLSEELKKNHRVTVLTSNTDFSRCEDVDGNLRVIRVPRIMELRSTALCATLPWELGRIHADIIHLHFPDPMAHLAYVWGGRSSKLVITWHSDIVRQRFLLAPYSSFLRRIVNRADRIIVSSPVMREKSPWLGSAQDRCVVIPFGVDLAKFELTPKVREKSVDARRRHGPALILFVGRLVYYKGLEYLLEAMQGIDGKLLVVGTGPLKSVHRRQVDQLGLGSKVEFLGEVSEEQLIALLHACDLFVLPSTERSETFGIVQLEAMACSKPVVCTNLPTGVPWVNQNERTGLVVPPRNALALQGAIQRLLKNPSLRQEFGEAARKRVESEFTNEVHAHRMLSVYESVLKGTVLSREVGA
ncbi:MAG TPA: glycosyltransferase [Terriglobia bacterium]|nr:glycosyltransferase [Terriglobia bacterium]